MTARDFCRAQNISMSSLFLWSSRLKREGEPKCASTVQLARVVRVASEQRSSEIVLERGGLRVRVAEQIAPDVLERVIGLLQRTAP